MSNFIKEWKANDIYNFDVELNRIENYNKYVEDWLKTYYGVESSLEHKVDWKNTDIVDLIDINRIKNNINKLLYMLNYDLTLEISTHLNQIWTSDQANKIEIALITLLEILGNYQFNNHITGLSITGYDLKLNMGE